VQTTGVSSGVTMADRTTGAGYPRWVNYPNLGFFRIWNNTNGDMLTISTAGYSNLSTAGSFDPATITGNHLATGHIRAANGWDATGFCALESGTTMCTATNSGTFYWGYLTSAAVMTSAMTLTGSNGNLSITGTLTQASSQRFKKDIHFLDRGEMDQALRTLEATPVATYRYKVAAPGSKVNYGVIAERTPPPLLSDDGKGVNLSNTVGILMAAVKAQQARIRELEARDKELEDIKAQLRALQKQIK
jgi:hypothetical protein